MNGFRTGSAESAMLGIRPDVVEDVIEALGAIARELPDLEHDLVRVETLSDLSANVAPVLTELGQVSQDLGRHLRWILESMLQFDISGFLPFRPGPPARFSPVYGLAASDRTLPTATEVSALARQVDELVALAIHDGAASVDATDLAGLQELLQPLSWRERAFLLSILAEHPRREETVGVFFTAVAALPALFSSELVPQSAARALGLPAGARFDPATALQAIEQGRSYREVELRQEHAYLLADPDRFLTPDQIDTKRTVLRDLAAEDGFTPGVGEAVTGSAVYVGEPGGGGQWVPRGLTLPPVAPRHGFLTPLQQGTTVLQDRLRDMSTDSGVIRQDEFGLTVHGNGNVTIVLPGVAAWGVAPENETARRSSAAVASFLPQDRLGLGATLDEAVGDVGPGRDVMANIYAQQVVAAVEDAVRSGVIEEGAETLLVGHSFGSATALDLVQDHYFQTLLTPTFVVATAYATDSRACQIPADTTLLTVNNELDRVVFLEELAEADLLTMGCDPLARAQGDALAELAESELRRAVVDDIDSARSAFAWAAERLGRPTGFPSVWPELAPTSTTWRAHNSIVATFVGPGDRTGHSLEEYVGGLDQLTANNGGSEAAAAVFESVADAGFATAGIAFAVDISTPLNSVQHGVGRVAEVVRDHASAEEDDN